MTCPPHSEPSQPAELPEDRRRRRPLSLSGAPQSRSSLVEQGFGDEALRHAVRAGAATRLVRGLYVEAQAVPSVAGDQEVAYCPGFFTPERLSPAALLTLRGLTDDGVHAASHETAALLHGISLPPPRGGRTHAPAGSSAEGVPPPALHLTRTDGKKALRRDGAVVSHRAEVPHSQLTQFAGILVTTPARTWADLAGQHSLLELLIMADQLLRVPRHEFGEQGEALARREELREAVAARRGARGVRAAREAAQMARAGVDSVRETQLRFALHQAGLPEMEVNPRLLHREGGRIREYQPDLFARDWKVGVQYEGRHHSDPAQVEKDVSRAELAEAMGILEIRITHRHTTPGWGPAVTKVARALRSRGWR